MPEESNLHISAPGDNGSPPESLAAVVCVWRGRVEQDGGKEGVEEWYSPSPCLQKEILQQKC